MTAASVSDAPAWSRVLSPYLTGHRRILLEAGVLTASTLVFLVSVLPNLANHPAVTDDEVWVMSASYKLARSGVFGSDMFRGFYHADQTYFFNLPAHHFAVAAAFKVLGAGVLQARLVGVGYGLATLFLTYFLARRLYGLSAAGLAVVLLLFLRLNMGFDTGLPLQELSASIRYDLAPVPIVLAGFWVLLGGSTLARAAIAGALFGLATLFQFYGVFAVVAAAVFFLLEPGAAVLRVRLIAVLAGATLLVCLPYGVFAASHLHDFRGQAGTVGKRDDFTSPGFYLHNLRNEVDRFIPPLSLPVGFTGPKGPDPLTAVPTRISPLEALPRRPSAKIGVILGLPAALIFAGWRGFREGRRADRLFFVFLASLPLAYALFDQLKLYVYWVMVVPFLCIGAAAVLAHLLRPPNGDRLRLALGVVAALGLLFVVGEGTVARIRGIRAAGTESQYAILEHRLHEVVPSGSRVVGSTSLWWALHDREFRSYFLFFYLTAPNAAEYRTTIPGFLQDFKPQYLVLTRLGESELQKHLITADLTAYQDYVSRNAVLVERLEGPDVHSYGYIDVWRFQSVSAKGGQ
jgi:4-amino-4-deoxy-L-arabinose transferase-like glycosyltransferase